MKNTFFGLVAAASSLFGAGPHANATELPASVLEYSATDIDGNEIALSDFRGKVVLIVNTASKCGFTYQYEGLQSLYELFGQDGFVVLGFPSDNFANQEYATEEEVAEFCQINFGVTFPLFAKVDVTGRNRHPVFSFLTQRETAGEFAGRVTWNFNKFLIDRSGKLIARFGSRVKPEDEKVIAAITSALAQ